MNTYVTPPDVQNKALLAGVAQDFLGMLAVMSDPEERRTFVTGFMGAALKQGWATCAMGEDHYHTPLMIEWVGQQARLHIAELGLPGISHGVHPPESFIHSIWADFVTTMKEDGIWYRKSHGEILDAFARYLASEYGVTKTQEQLRQYNLSSFDK